MSAKENAAIGQLRELFQDADLPVFQGVEHRVRMLLILQNPIDVVFDHTAPTGDGLRPFY